MRTFESLGAGRKIITTNPNVKKYPFYDQNNIYVIERGKIDFNQDFFKSDFSPIANELILTMSLEGWIKEIFGLTTYYPWDSLIDR